MQISSPVFFLFFSLYFFHVFYFLFIFVLHPLVFWLKFCQSLIPFSFCQCEKRFRLLQLCSILYATKKRHISLYILTFIFIPYNLVFQSCIIFILTPVASSEVLSLLRQGWTIYFFMIYLFCFIYLILILFFFKAELMFFYCEEIRRRKVGTCRSVCGWMHFWSPWIRLKWLIFSSWRDWIKVSLMFALQVESLRRWFHSSFMWD